MKVELQNLTKVFPSRNKKENSEVIAVNNFTFEIPDGKLVGLLGPSGCGKSTTLYMISVFRSPRQVKSSSEMRTLPISTPRTEVLDLCSRTTRFILI